MKRASPILAALLLLTGVQAATAATVIREPAPLPDLIEDTSCGYLIDVTFPVNDEYAIVQYDGDGNFLRVIIQGPLVATFTNDATGESITANISGPSIFSADGSGKLLGQIGGPVPGFAFLVLFSGYIDTVTGEFHGHLSANLCEALAP
jgi:hypothetical protein